jgi:hypothetical protein
VPASPEIKSAFQAALPSAKSLGAAYNKRVPAVPAIPTDYLPGLTAAGSRFWNSVNNNSVALQFTGKVRRRDCFLEKNSFFPFRFSVFQPRFFFFLDPDKKKTHNTPSFPLRRFPIGHRARIDPPRCGHQVH